MWLLPRGATRKRSSFRFRESLAPVAREKASLFEKQFDQSDGVSFVTRIRAYRTGVFFGEIRGSVTIHSRRPGPNGEPVYGGVTYSFVGRDGVWVEVGFKGHDVDVARERGPSAFGE